MAGLRTFINLVLDSYFFVCSFEPLKRFENDQKEVFRLVLMTDFTLDIIVSYIS
jgi:hypothetical protein